MGLVIQEHQKQDFGDVEVEVFEALAGCGRVADSLEGVFEGRRVVASIYLLYSSAGEKTPEVPCTKSTPPSCAW